MAPTETLADVNATSAATAVTSPTMVTSLSPFVTETTLNATYDGHKQLVDKLFDHINATLNKNFGEREGRYYETNVTSAATSLGKNVFQGLIL